MSKRTPDFGVQEFLVTDEEIASALAEASTRRAIEEIAKAGRKSGIVTSPQPWPYWQYATVEELNDSRREVVEELNDSRREVEESPWGDPLPFPTDDGGRS